MDIVLTQMKDSKEAVEILSPVVRGRKGEYYQLLYNYLNLGYSQARIDGQYYSLRDQIKLAATKKHDIEIVVDTVWLNDETRLFEAIENALAYSGGLMIAKLPQQNFYYRLIGLVRMIIFCFSGSGTTLVFF